MSECQLFESSSADYHSPEMSAAMVSHSEMEVFRKSAKLYNGRFLTREYPRDKASDALNFGTVCHELLLERPDKLRCEDFARPTIARWHNCQLSMFDTSETPDIDRPGHEKIWFRDDRAYRQSFYWGAYRSNAWPLMGSLPRAQQPLAFALYTECRLINNAFVPVPTDVLTSNGQRRGKAWDQFKDQQADQVPLLVESQRSNEDFTTLARIIPEILEHDLARRCYELDGQNELNISWVDDEFQIGSRCRIDMVRVVGSNHHDGSYTSAEKLIVDFKTAESIEVKTWGKRAVNLGYHRQVAWYQDGYEQLTGEQPPFAFLVACKKPPYDVEMLELEPELIEVGRQQNRRDLEWMARCRDSGHWKSRTHGRVVRIPTPQWAMLDEWEVQADDQ